jgi:predicted negative regulator of RcsB-dependent stress response
VIGGVAIGVAILFGYKYWTQHQEQQRLEAAGLYAQLLETSRARPPEKAHAAGERLVREFDGTPYAGMAALVLARMATESGDVTAARRHLEWAMANAQQDAVKHAARLRLARLLASGGEDTAALALAATKDTAGFEAEYAELRGDLLLKLGRREEARTAYREALERARDVGGYQTVLKMKLNDLGPENRS